MTVAYWCIFAFFWLGWLPVLFAKILAGDLIKANYNPRAHLDKSEGLAKRFYNIHLNSIEMFAPFAVAVIVAELAGKLPQITIDRLAVAFLVTRLLYIIAYAKNWAPLRTLIWWIGALITLSFFVLSAS